MKRWMVVVAVMAVSTTAKAMADGEPEKAKAKPLARTLPTTRAHVLPPWEIEYEQWWRGTWARGGGDSHLFRSEVEMGLPGRFHVAVYEDYELTTQETFRHRSVDFEGRWAFADYGECLLNPTLYGEWKVKDEAPDAYELKLLLAEDLTEKWWWAFNVLYEQEVGGAREQEIGFTQALMYKIKGRSLAAGIEMKYEYATENGSRDNPEQEVLVGPSVLCKLHDRVKVRTAPLFGVTGHSPHVQAFVLVEVELWEPKGH